MVCLKFFSSLWKNKFMKIVRKNNSSLYEMKKMGMFKFDFISSIYKVPLSIFIKTIYLILRIYEF